MKFHVADMSCGQCAAAIDTALRVIDPDARVDSDLTSKTVTIMSAQDAATLQAALKEAGYPATLA